MNSRHRYCGVRRRGGQQSEAHAGRDPSAVQAFTGVERNWVGRLGSDWLVREQMRDRAPFRVCRMVHDSAVNPVAFPQVKFVVITAGWTNLVHRERTRSLAEGDIAVLPAGALVGGEPISGSSQLRV